MNTNEIISFLALMVIKLYLHDNLSETELDNLSSIFREFKVTKNEVKDES